LSVLAVSALAFGLAPKAAAQPATPPNATEAISVAEALKRGVEAAARNDDAKALLWFRKAADQGNANAQLNLGTMYLTGRGVPKDDAMALSWFRKAAEQGIASAQFQVGNSYLLGRGVARDEAMAMTWFRKAAELNDAWAEFQLGNMYRDGRGQPRDFPQAVICFQKAAAQGISGAELVLGVMYLRGEGVTPDPQAAMSWFQKAAGHEVLANDPNAAPLNVVKAQAQFMVAAMYEEGVGVPKDITQAISWYRKSAVLGNVGAKTNLALLEKSFSVKPEIINLVCQTAKGKALVSIDTSRKSVTLKSGAVVEYKDGNKFYVRVTNDAIEFGCRNSKSDMDVLENGLAWMMGDNKKASWASGLTCIMKNRIDRRTKIWTTTSDGKLMGHQSESADCSLTP
jgi:TPR repeat protein